jgi:uncharacterized protein YbaR (Trm112 family)
MFIELTDHLRCPAAHDEQFLVLLPGEVKDRSVREGHLGCPVCGRTFRLVDGVFDLGDAPTAGGAAEPLAADAVAALVGLNGPGGYLLLVGAVGAGWRGVGEAIPGVGLVVLNPPDGVADEPGVSVLRGGMIPLKRNTVRGVVLSPPFGGDPHWVEEAVRVTLPGLRVVGGGPEPRSDAVELLASAGGYWVGAKTRAGSAAGR